MPSSILNPWKFVEIKRYSNAILISYNIGNGSWNITQPELVLRIQQLRRNGISDISMAQELLALREYEKEKSRDDWVLETSIEEVDSFLGG